MGAVDADEPLVAGNRDRILDTARKLFVEQGFAATSTRELSEILGFTKAALYYHFRTKDDLLAALLQPVIDDLTSFIKQTPIRASASARRAVLAAQIDIVTTHLDLLRVLIQDPSASCRPASECYKPLQGRLLQLLAGQEEPDVTASARARAALGAVYGALLLAEPADDPSVVRHAAFVAACAALGVPTPPGTP